MPKCINCKNKRPNFSDIDEKPAKYCKSCIYSLKIEIFFDVIHHKCEKCKTRPIYNFKGKKKARFCVSHKELDMVNIVDKKCEFPNCDVQPTYNFKGEKKARFCNIHKKLDMIDIKNKKCEFSDCDILSSFNFKGEKKARFCNIHKEFDMINIKDKKCEFPNCDIQSIYNFKGEKKARFCNIHKECDMFDIKNKKCEFLNCDVQPIYNFKGEKKARFCNIHKEPNMINNKHKKCEFSDCDILPSFNFKGEKKARFCNIHKEPNMIRISKDFCVSCNLTRKQNKYGDLCYLCFVFKNPEHIYIKNYKTKENEVTSYLKTSHSMLSFIFDKRIENGCSTRRPDILLHLGFKVIIIEVDENQHNDYDTICEEQRINDLYSDLYFAPILFIRFNPDGYKTKEKSIRTPWITNKETGKIFISLKNKDWLNRMNVLSNTLNENLKNKQEEFIKIINLFYDEI